jgi:hypothetical protein
MLMCLEKAAKKEIFQVLSQFVSLHALSMPFILPFSLHLSFLPVGLSGGLSVCF